MLSINGSFRLSRNFRACLVLYLGTDVNSLFTSLLKSGSTSASWCENCSGVHHLSWVSWCMVLICLVACTKRGSGWRRCRALLGMSSDQIPSLSPLKPRNPCPFPHRSPYCFILPRFLPLFLRCVLITAYLSDINPFVRIHRVWCHYPSVGQLLDLLPPLAYQHLNVLYFTIVTPLSY
jgi:hypothetical protein